MQRGFSLIEIIFFCFGMSLMSVLIFPNAVKYFQRTTLFLETQRLHTNFRLVQNANYSTTSKTSDLDFFQTNNQTGNIMLQINSNTNSYKIFEYRFGSTPSQSFITKKFPSWLQIQSNSNEFIFFNKYGNLINNPFTVTLSRDNSNKKGEKYTIILHNQGRIRTDFVDADGK